MQKIPTLFRRNPENMKLVTAEVTPGCEWVLAGEGRATAKLNGTCCRITIKHGEAVIWRRREIKANKPLPVGFESAGHDAATMKTVGWVPCNVDDPSDQYHYEGLENLGKDVEPGTYELVGPKVQGNDHGYERHELVRHGSIPIVSLYEIGKEFGLTHTTIWTYCTSGQLGHYEGIVWHHDDGRMAKIKKRDFE